MNLFISDLDGTLLDLVEDLGQKNQEALQALHNAGYKIVLASGRQMMDTTALSLGDIQPYRILLNGSQIFDDKDQLIYEATLPYEKVESMLAYCQKKKILFLVYTKDTRYVSLPSNIMQQFYDVAKAHGDDEETIVNRIKMMNEMYATHTPYTKKIATQLQNGDEAIYKIEIVHASSKVLATFEKKINDDSISISSSWPTNREITAGGVNKGAALAILCEHIKTSLSNCIAIGDSRNDIEMLSCVGYSIAMNNANQDVKDVCDYVTASCEDSGVAQAITHILTK